MLLYGKIESSITNDWRVPVLIYFFNSVFITSGSYFYLLKQCFVFNEKMKRNFEFEFYNMQKKIRKSIEFLCLSYEHECELNLRINFSFTRSFLYMFFPQHVLVYLSFPLINKKCYSECQVSRKNAMQPHLTIRCIQNLDCYSEFSIMSWTRKIDSPL